MDTTIIQGSLFETEDAAPQPCNTAEPETKSSATAHKANGVKSPDAKKAVACLAKISADCDYETWFRVCCALKHSGCRYDNFKEWSATAPDRFSEAECKRTWEAVAEDTDNKIGLGTLLWLADENSGMAAMLPIPQTAA